MRHKKLLALTFLFPLLLSSCRGFDDFYRYFDSYSKVDDISYDVPEKTVEIDVFNLIKTTKKHQKNKDYIPKRSEIYARTIHVMFYDDEELVPYLSLNDFFNVLNSLYESSSSNPTFVTTDKDATYSFQSGGDFVFEFKDNYEEGAFYINGDLSMYLNSSNEAIDSSLQLGSKYTDYNLYGDYSKNEKKRSYIDAGYEIHEEEGIRYYPLSLLNISFSDYTTMTFFYNYEDIYIFDDYEYFHDEFAYYEGLNVKHPYVSFYNYAYSRTDKMIEAVKKDRLSSYLFFLQNFYGLKSTWEWDDKEMDDYLNSFNFKDNLLSSNDNMRKNALANLIYYLDDAHTSFYFTSPYERASSYRPSSYNTKINSMVLSIRAIDKIRNESNLIDINYSKDNKTALFILESFDGIDTDYKGKSASELAQSDDFFYVADKLKTIKEKGGVENVIIDISTNGGGYVLTMMKIGALISSSNSFGLTFHDDSSYGYEVYNVAVDSNLDNKYDLDDVYGDDFNIYIMTSSYSFSCANSFPFLAQKVLGTHIIGETSGGGECSVLPLVLPTGEMLYHSYSLHIGYYDANSSTWYSSESGARVEDKYYIGYENTQRYDMEYLSNLIK